MLQPLEHDLIYCRWRRVNPKGSLGNLASALYEVQIGAVAQDPKLARRSFYASATLQGTAQVI